MPYNTFTIHLKPQTGITDTFVRKLGIKRHRLRRSTKERNHTELTVGQFLCCKILVNWDALQKLALWQASVIPQLRKGHLQDANY